MKIPFVEKEEVLRIIRDFPTPFHLYDEKGIRQNARALKKAFSWNKGFRQYFAVKATPNPFILKILHEEGCGMDCSSLTELMLVQACGITGEDIMFSSNMTPEEDFVYARCAGAVINLDDITHIPFLEKAAGLPSIISCRYNPGGSFVINNSIMDTPGEAKYGFTRPQLTEGFHILKQKGIREFGLHAFLASNTLTGEYYASLSRILFRTAVELRNETGAHIAFINLSGGVGIPYRPEEKALNINDVASGVREAFEEILTPEGMGDVAIYTELGRFMLAPYGALITKVIHKKHTYKEYLGVDACAANLMRPAMYGAYHHITVLGKETAPKVGLFDVVGGLCENNDKFAINRDLPAVDIGDILYIHDTGAHGFSMGYNYNGKLLSAEILIKEDRSAELIRRAQTPADYFSGFDYTGLFKSVL